MLLTGSGILAEFFPRTFWGTKFSLRFRCDPLPDTAAGRQQQFVSKTLTVWPACEPNSAVPGADAVSCKADLGRCGAQATKFLFLQDQLFGRLASQTALFQGLMQLAVRRIWGGVERKRQK
jgi:hypothetical protein